MEFSNKFGALESLKALKFWGAEMTLETFKLNSTLVDMYNRISDERSKSDASSL